MPQSLRRCLQLPLFAMLLGLGGCASTYVPYAPPDAALMRVSQYGFFMTYAKFYRVDPDGVCRTSFTAPVLQGDGPADAGFNRTDSPARKPSEMPRAAMLGSPPASAQNIVELQLAPGEYFLTLTGQTGHGLCRVVRMLTLEAGQQYSVTNFVPEPKMCALKFDRVERVQGIPTWRPLALPIKPSLCREQ